MAKPEISIEKYKELLKRVKDLEKTEADLRKIKDTLAEAQRITHLGNWNWDLVNNTLGWSDEIYRIFGLKPQEFGATYDAFLNSVHPEDRELVTQAVNEALNNKQSYSIDHRIILPDGSVRIVHEQAEVTFDNSNSPIRMLGTVQDITERAVAEEAKDVLENRMQSSLILSRKKFITEEEIVEYSLEESVKLTKSNIGYLHFVNEDQKTISLYRWSKDVLNACDTKKEPHYPIESAGVWVECVHKKQPVIHNDYQNLSNKKGYPEGHVHVVRHMSVPIFDKGKIVAIVGVGNKVDPYTQIDAQQLSLFISHMWEIVNRKRAEVELKQYQIHLEELVKERTLKLEQSIELTQTLLDSLPFPALLNHKNKTILSANQIAKEMGAEVGTFCWQSFMQGIYIPEEDKDYINQHKEIPPKGTHCIFCQAENAFKSQESITKKIEAWGKVWEAHWVPVDNKRYLHYAADITKRAEFDNLRKQFIYTVSHELRTPISVISLAVTNLQKYGIKLTEDQRIEIMNSISRNAGLLTDLIEDLLLISRLNIEKIRLNQIDYNISEVLQDVLNQLESRQKTKQMTIKCDVTQDIQLYGDPMRIGQIFRIFIDNAIKYSDEKSKIEIIAVDHYKGRYNPDAVDGVLIQFIDEGRGIREQDIPNIFERFFRSEDVEGIPGTGLGLSIAQNLAQLHQGNVYVESTYQKGSNFLLFLPRLKVPSEEE